MYSLSSIILLIDLPSIEVIMSPVLIPLEIAGLFSSIWTTYIPEVKFEAEETYGITSLS